MEYKDRERVIYCIAPVNAVKKAIQVFRRGVQEGAVCVLLCENLSKKRIPFTISSAVRLRAEVHEGEVRPEGPLDDDLQGEFVWPCSLALADRYGVLELHRGGLETWIS